MIYILVCDYSPFRNKVEYLRLPSLDYCESIAKRWCRQNPYGAAKAMTEQQFVDFCQKNDIPIPPLAKGE